MIIKNTLFGTLYHIIPSLICKKKNIIYNEIFMLNNYYIGKTNFQLYNNNLIKSNIYIVNKELTNSYKEIINLTSNYYLLECNIKNINFNDIPKDLLDIMKNDKYILQKFYYTHK